MNKFISSILFLLFLLCDVALVQGVSYTVTDLGFLEGEEYSYAYGINNSGQVVGVSGNDGRAFLYQNGSMIDLGTLGGTFSGAERINAGGQIVGSAAKQGGGCHAFVYRGESLANLGSLASGSSFGYGINDAGKTVGFSYASDGEHAFYHDGERMFDLGKGIAYDINNAGLIVGENGHAFLYKNEVTTDLGTLGGEHSEAHAINDAGQVVGWANTPDGGDHAFLFENGVMKDLGALGEASSMAFDINSRGQIVGNLNSPFHFGFGDSPPNYAFIYQDGVMNKLNDLIDPSSDWFLNFAYGINDAGQIVGSGIHNGKYSAFLLTPIPEPSMLALLGIGAMSLAIFIRRPRTPLRGNKVG